MDKVIINITISTASRAKEFVYMYYFFILTIVYNTLETNQYGQYENIQYIASLRVFCITVRSYVWP